MKKHILFAMLLVIVLLTSSAPFAISQSKSQSIQRSNGVTVTKQSTGTYYATSKAKEISTPIHHVSSYNDPWVGMPGDQIHPAIGATNTGLVLAAFKDVNLDNILFTCDVSGSTDDFYYFPMSWDYPSIDSWNDKILFWTVVTSNDCDGHTDLIYTDASDFPYYIYNWDWDWSTVGWHGMKDADIACDNSSGDWNFGACSYIMSNSSGGYTDVPVLMFQTSTNYDAVLQWLPFEGCQHNCIDIDPVTHLVYAVYDYFNASLNKWDLLIWVKDFANPIDGYNNVYEISGAGNLQYPSISVNGSHLAIVAETDQNGNKDIICFYSNDGMNNLHTSYVRNGGDDERYPNIVYGEYVDLYGNIKHFFSCTFMKNNNFWAIYSSNYGATWDLGHPNRINQYPAVEEYKSADINILRWQQPSSDWIPGVWEETRTDIDVIFSWSVTLDQDFPTAPIIHGPQHGKVGTAYNYTFNSTAFDEDGVSYYIDWGDGTYTDWTNYYPSGHEVTFSHTWTKKGSYTIRAKAATLYYESDWGTLPVTMPLGLPQSQGQQSSQQSSHQSQSYPSQNQHQIAQEFIHLLRDIILRHQTASR